MTCYGIKRLDTEKILPERYDSMVEASIGLFEIIDTHEKMNSQAPKMKVVPLKDSDIVSTKSGRWSDPNTWKKD